MGNIIQFKTKNEKLIKTAEKMKELAAISIKYGCLQTKEQHEEYYKCMEEYKKIVGKYPDGI